MNKKILVLISTLVAIFSVQAISLAVWVGPTLTPPFGNLPSPLNLSSTEQTKSGTLVLGGFPYGLIIQTGNIGIGTTNPGAKLHSYASSYQNRLLGVSDIALDTTDPWQGAVQIKVGNTGENWLLNTVSYSATGKGVRFYNNGGVGYTAFEVAQAGGSRFIVNGTGNVGIGLTSPDANYKLTTTAGGVKAENSSASQPAGYFSNGSTGPSLVTGTGNVGIGTTAPTAKLDVVGGMQASSYIVTPNLSSYGTGNLLIDTASNAHDINFGASYMTIKSGGNVGIGTASLSTINATAGLFSSVTPKTEILTGSGSGTYKEAVVIRHNAVDSTAVSRELGLLLKTSDEASLDESNKTSGMMWWSNSSYGNNGNFSLVHANNKVLTSDFSGNIGIGTTAPGAKLDVAGTIKISGGTPGAGKVLTSDANGLASWTTPTSGLGGSGTINKIAKFTAGTTLGDSQIFDNGTNVGIGLTSPDANYKLTTTAGGVKAENSSASQPSIYASNAGGGPALVTGTGNVGIGTTAPDNLLTVNGTIQGSTLYATTQVAATSVTANYISGGANLNLYAGGTSGYMTFSTAGEKMRITSGGNVGIGTAAPAAPLNTYKAPVVSTFVEQIRVGGTGNYPSLTFGTYDAYDGYIATYGNDLRILSGKGVASENHNIHFYTSFNGVGGEAENNERMTILSNGNVGIGTAAPDEKLTVNGAIRTTTNAVSWNTQLSGLIDYYGNNMRIVATAPTATSNGIAFFTTNSGTTGQAMQILPNGNVGIGTVTPGAKLQILGSNTADVVTSDIVLGRWWASTSDTRGSSIFHYYTATPVGRDFMAFGVSGNGGSNGQPNALAQAKMIIEASGNVGIGTTAPGQKLTIEGTAPILEMRSAGHVMFRPAANDSDMRIYGGGTQPNMYLGFTFGGAPTTALMAIRQDGNVGIASTTPWGLLSVNPNGITGPAFVVGSSTATKFIVTNGGNVGIGTINPTGLFQVGGGNLTVTSSGYVGIGTATPSVLMQVSASSGFGNQLITTAGAGSSFSASTFYATDFSGVAVYSGIGTSNGNLVLTRSSSLEGSPHLVINQSGYVGIGTTAPTVQFERSCPAGFTNIKAGNNQLGCMQTAATDNAIAAWWDANNYCFTTYGGRIPTVSEWYIAANNYTLSGEIDDWEWVSDPQVVGSSFVGLRIGGGGLQLLQGSSALTNANPYRCFIPR